MKDFRTLFQQWKAIRESIDPLDLQKLNTLMTQPEEQQIPSSFLLLYSYGDSALCELLEMVDAQICLRNDISFLHRVLWEKCVIEEVCHKDNEWNGLYLSGFFRQMEFHVLGSLEWNRLSPYQKKLTLQESLRMVSILPGSFMMGALPNDKLALKNALPRHRVTITKGFEVCIYPVTQGLYTHVMNRSPSQFKGASKPVESVSWCEAVLFCNELSKQEGLKPVYILETPFKQS